MAKNRIFLNNFSVGPAAAINAGDTSIVLPGNTLREACLPYYDPDNPTPVLGTLTISEGSTIMEIVVFDSIPTTTDGGLTNNIAVQRAQEGTTAQDFTTAASVEMRVTAGICSELSDAAVNAGGSIPIRVPKRLDSSAVEPNTLYFDDASGFLLLSLNSGTTNSTAPLYSDNAQVSDGTVEFICYLVDQDTVEADPGDPAYVLITSTGVGLSPGHTAGAAYVSTGGLGFLSVGLGGLAANKNAVALGNVVNPVPNSFMHSGIPIIPSGYDTYAYSAPESYSAKGGGSVAVLMTPTFDFKNTGGVNQLLPVGTTFYVDEVGVIFDDSSVNITTLPTVRFGASDGGDELLSDTLLSGSYAAPTRKVFTPNTYDGANYLSFSISTAAAGDGTLYGRAYFKGLFIAPETLDRQIVNSGGGG